MKLNVGLPEILLDLGIITSTNGNYLLITRNAEEFIIRWRETKRMDLTEKIDRGQEKAWIVWSKLYKALTPVGWEKNES